MNLFEKCDDVSYFDWNLGEFSRFLSYRKKKYISYFEKHLCVFNLIIYLFLIRLSFENNNAAPQMARITLEEQQAPTQQVCFILYVFI